MNGESAMSNRISVLLLLSCLTALPACGPTTAADILDLQPDAIADGVAIDILRDSDPDNAPTDPGVHDGAVDVSPSDSFPDPELELPDGGDDGSYTDGESENPDSRETDVPDDDGPDAWFSCDICENDDECADGWACKAVRVEKFCVKGCMDDGDCDPGFTCEKRDDGNFCIPVTQNCLSCMGDEPCPPGKCCDFITGYCMPCGGECAPCWYDFDCLSGYRCFNNDDAGGGVCVPDCAGGTCEDTSKFECVIHENGVRLCEPFVQDCGGCHGDTPYLIDGECFECLADSDCLPTEECLQSGHACRKVKCPEPLQFCVDDRQCHQCCGQDSQCDYGDGSAGQCLQDRTCSNYPPCGGLCTVDFPVCTTVQGVEKCVQCATDNDCAMIGPDCHCSGDPLYSCVDSEGLICTCLP